MNLIKGIIVPLVLSSLTIGAIGTVGMFFLGIPITNLNAITTDTTYSKDITNNTDKAQNTVSNTLTSTIKNISSVISNVKETSPVPPLVLSAREQVGVTLLYDPAYVKLDFPMGDLPVERGVCTDVVIRAYRKQGKDLQALVNRDMKQAWSQYPKIWGLKSTDKNIDHRRVPNLRQFFKRHGTSLEVSEYKKILVNNTTQADINISENEAAETNASKDFLAGDLVSWKISGRPHIGIVSNRTTRKGTPLIIHNIGRGTQENDILFKYPMTGHYRY